MLAIATNTPVLLMTGFVVQGHIWSQSNIKFTYFKWSSVGSLAQMCLNSPFHIAALLSCFFNNHSFFSLTSMVWFYTESRELLQLVRQPSRWYCHHHRECGGQRGRAVSFRGGPACCDVSACLSQQVPGCWGQCCAVHSRDHPRVCRDHGAYWLGKQIIKKIWYNMDSILSII